MFKELLASAVVGAGSIFAVSCDNSNETIIKEVQNPNNPILQIDKIKGDSFEISRIGKNVFKVSGDNRTPGVNYITEMCDVISVGAWELENISSTVGHDHIDQVAVTVSNEDCLTDLR